MCCYRDIKNFERFHLVVQSLICLAVVQFKSIEILVAQHNNRLAGASSSSSGNHNSNINNNSGENSNNNNNDASAGGSDVSDNKADNTSKSEDTDSDGAGSNGATIKSEEAWTLSEVEKLLILVAKAFLINFPLYIAYKHAVHSRLDDISPQEAQVGFS